MFRRRTDQVYATLQQVQRRITEQSGAGTPNLEPKSALQPTFAPLHEALPAQRQALQDAAAINAPQQPQPMRSGRFSIYLSGQFAVTLIVLWIASCVLCFVLGQHERDRRAPNATIGYAPGDAGNREAPAEPTKTPAKPLGEWILVLTSDNVATPDLERKYQERAGQLNDIMAKNASRGWKPYFGIRRPENGGLQLVFGEVADGVFGVSRKEFEEFAVLMAKSSGGGYASAKWLKLN